MCPYQRIGEPETFPEVANPRVPWDEHGPGEQAYRLRKALGDELFQFLKELDDLRKAQTKGDVQCP